MKPIYRPKPMPLVVRVIFTGLVIMAGVLAVWSLSAHAAKRERRDDADSTWVCKFDAHRCSESRTAIRGIR